ncbi:MAG: hypothetical protein RSA29_14190 [Clostridium sp.]|uniref:hypothetical protein n=1 Tax=Clostridium sp. TaxID=1506 RepID=UPI003217E2AE
MKRALTLREKSILVNGGSGIIYIAFAFLQIFATNRFEDGTLYILIMLLGLITVCFKTEPEDEMAQYNKYRTKAKIYDLIYSGLLIYVLMFLFEGVGMINLKIVLPFLLGVFNLLELIIFVSYEKAGD